MKIDKKDLGKNQIELTIEVENSELGPYLERAAVKLSTKNKIPGFRPGKAPLELVQKNLGEMAVYQAAVDEVVSKTYYQAVTENKLETVGRPDIKIEKLAPGNSIIYKAIAAILPTVELGQWTELNVEQKKIEATDEEVKKTINQLLEMNVKEAVVNRAIKNSDKVEVDFEVLINKAVVEGGKNNKYPVIIGQKRMVPGFEEKMLGHKAKDEFEFELKFPDKYFQANLAGKTATFKVKVLAVYERNIPQLDDSYAKGIGFDTVDKLRAQLKLNIVQDKEIKEKQRVEGEAIKAIVAQATIGAIPDSLVDNEVHKMEHELEHSIGQQGMDMAGYLKSINKSKEDLQKDFRPQAVERVQAALVMRAIAASEKMKASNEEIEEEINKQKVIYKDNKEFLKNFALPTYRDHIANLLINQKVINLIRQKIIK